MSVSAGKSEGYIPCRRISAACRYRNGKPDHKALFQFLLGADSESAGQLLSRNSPFQVSPSTKLLLPCRATRCDPSSCPASLQKSVSCPNPIGAHPPPVDMSIRQRSGISAAPHMSALARFPRKTPFAAVPQAFWAWLPVGEIPETGWRVPDVDTRRVATA